MEGVRIYKGKQAGPVAVIIASLHGEEPAGMAAYAWLKEFFENGGELLKGEVRLVKGNIEARKAGIRYFKYDLNRMFLDEYPEDIDTECYEYKRAQEIKEAIQGANHILDLHSMTSAGEPFSILTGQDDENLPDYLVNLPVSFFSTGWKGALVGPLMDWAIPRGMDYVAVECGLNGSDEADEVARETAKAFLNQIGLTNFDVNYQGPQRHLRLMKRIPIGDHDTYEYPEKTYSSFDPLEPNELIAQDKTQEYRAPDQENLVIVMPASQESVRKHLNNDAFYFAEFIDSF